MDRGVDSGVPSPQTTVGDTAMEQEGSAGCQTESGGPLLLQLLEFKTHLFEAVEELHIRKDAETRFEGQISKLMLEKQELEWEKESLQRHIETVATQHSVSLTSVKQQFQAKIRNLEEEKGKYQITAELKDKEINNLKEELRSLQLLKYNSENKSNELEQKLALQSRAKDSHLSQLGEVEKRFSALARQCAVVKQAHEKLKQDVDEATRINKKLTSVNEKQEATIVSLKKELEELSNKLIKEKITAVTYNKRDSPTQKEQEMQKLHQKLNMETEMNIKLREENVAVRAEKQEVMRSLQHTQKLLLSQTQAVNRAELELQTQKEQYQALKQEHEVMRDKSKAMEDKVAQLMESCAASKTSWDKENKALQDRIKREEQDHQAVRKAYNELCQKHSEKSSLAKMINSSQSLHVLTHPPNEPASSFELPGFGRLQHLASSQTRNPDCLEDTGAVTNLDATGATEGQSLNLFSCPLINKTLLSPCGQDQTTGKESVSHHCLLLNKVTAFVSSGGHRSVSGSVGSPGKEKTEGGNKGMRKEKLGGKCDKNTRKEEERYVEHQWKTEEVQGEDAEEGSSTGEKRGRLKAQITDRAGRREDSRGSAEDTLDTRNPETETRDRAEEQRTHGAERGETPEKPETQIQAQTTVKKSNRQQVIDFMDTESPRAVWTPSDCSESLSRTVTDEDHHSSSVTKVCGNVGGQVLLTLSPDDSPRSNRGPQTVAEPLLPNQIQQVPEKVTEFTDKSAAELSAPQSQSNLGPSPVQSKQIQELETTTAQDKPSDLTGNTNQTDELCEIRVNEECVELGEPQSSPHSRDMSEQETGQLKSPLTGGDDHDGDSGAYKKSKGQSNKDTREKYPDETLQKPAENRILKDVCVDPTMDTIHPKSEAESGSFPDCVKDDKINDAAATKTCLKPSVKPTGDKSSFSSVSVLHPFVQGSELITGGSGGRLRLPPRTRPMFTESKLSKVPLVITRVSDLLNASSVCGNAATSTRHQPGEWKALGETAAHTESRASRRITSSPVSPSSISFSELSQQAAPGCGRAPTSAAGPFSESDWDSCCSLEREDQQSSFRAQISKIEQFLNAERLRLPKRPRIDDET